MSCVDGLRSPSLQNERFVVVIVENTLVSSVTPDAIEAGVSWFGSTEGVGTRNSSCESPSTVVSSSSIIIDMVDEDRF